MTPVLQPLGDQPEVLLGAAAVAVGDGDQDVQAPDRPPSLARNAGSAALFVGKAVTAFLASIVFTRSVGAAGRGEIVFVYNTAGMLVLLAGAGTASALVRLKTRAGIPSTNCTQAHWSPGDPRLVARGLFAGGVRASCAAPPSTAWAPAALAVAGLVGPLLLVTNLTQVAALHDRLGGHRGHARRLGRSTSGLVLLGAPGLSVGLVIAAFAAGSVVPLTPSCVWPVSGPRSRPDRRLTRVLLRIRERQPGGHLGPAALADRHAAGEGDAGLRRSRLVQRGDVDRRDRLVLVMSARWALLPRHGSGAPSARVHRTVARMVRTGVAAARC